MIIVNIVRRLLVLIDCNDPNWDGDIDIQPPPLLEPIKQGRHPLVKGKHLIVPVFDRRPLLICAGPVFTHQLRRSAVLRERILKYCYPLQCPTWTHFKVLLSLAVPHVNAFSSTASPLQCPTWKHFKVQLVPCSAPRERIFKYSLSHAVPNVNAF